MKTTLPKKKVTSNFDANNSHPVFALCCCGTFGFPYKKVIHLEGIGCFLGASYLINRFPTDEGRLWLELPHSLLPIPMKSTEIG